MKDSLKRILHYSKKVLQVSWFMLYLAFFSFMMRRKQKKIESLRAKIIRLKRSKTIRDIRMSRLLNNKRVILEQEVIELSDKCRAKAKLLKARRLLWNHK